MVHQDFVLLFHGFILLLVHGSWASHQRRGLGAGVSQVTDFDCPEEFGYYPHPTDCTQYYVCVFGGALLESCTGGLMYSHELQTCDWPRNVGCGENSNSDSGTVSTVRVTDPRTRAPQHSSRPVTNSQQNTAAPQTLRNSHRQEYIRHRQPEVIQQQLYTEEDLGPAEEIESDRQQRVYRGQPSTIGQVQRDRDGLRPLKNSVHSHNVIPTGPDPQEKISVVPYASQRPSAPRAQDQYSDNTTNTGDVYIVTDEPDATVGNATDFISRRKRQIPYRIGSYGPVKVAKIPVILIPGTMASVNERLARYLFHPNDGYPEMDVRLRTGPLPGAPNDGYREQLQHGTVGQHPQFNIHGQKNPKANPNRVPGYGPPRNKTFDLKKLTESTIQTEFRPIVQQKDVGTRHTDSPIRLHPSTKKVPVPQVPTAASFLLSNVLSKLANTTNPKTWRSYFGLGDTTTTTTERVVAITSRIKDPRWTSTVPHKFPVGASLVNQKDLRAVSELPLLSTRIKGLITGKTTEESTFASRKPNFPTTSNVHLDYGGVTSTTEKVQVPLYRFVETPKNYIPKSIKELMSTEKSNQGRDYDTSERNPYSYDYYDREYEDYINNEKDTFRVVTNIMLQQTESTSTEAPRQEQYDFSGYDYDSRETPKSSSYEDYYDDMSSVGQQEMNKTESPAVTFLPKFEEPTTKARFRMNGDRVNMDTVRAISNSLTRPLRFRSTTIKPTTQNQVETPGHKVPEMYLTRHLSTEYSRTTSAMTVTDDGRRHSTLSNNNRITPPKMPKMRVDPVQNYQVTSALPPLTPTQRTIERYNNSQRYQPAQYDQYYTVYDEDADLYRGNDYVQQEYQPPSSTPSSNIVHQYRGHTTFKQQQQQQQQAIELEQSRDSVQNQQPLRNSYNQDVYSPTPVVQDYNDQYNTQIDDQQYQHLGPSTPKSPSRSVSTNSSKDASPQPSITVTRIPDKNASKTDSAERRSDPISYFEASDILVPPPRGVPRPTPATQKFAYTTEGYRTIAPTTQRSAEPPRNGGAVAKTLNNFDSLLTSFFSSVGASARRSPTGKGSPETIVRSEIGRIHHDPIIITDDFRESASLPRKPEPTPSPTPFPVKNDYLTYYVEIEPKKPKPDPAFIVPKSDVTTDAEPKVITKEDSGDQSEEVRFNLRRGNRPYSNFVRLYPNGDGRRNIQLSTSLDIEPILKQTTNEKPPEDGDKKLELLSFKRDQFPPSGRAAAFVIPRSRPVEYDVRKEQQEIPSDRPRNRGGNVFRPRPLDDEPRLIENANPYKFVVVDAERTEKPPQTPTPFIRNPENEDRNRDLRNRFRFRALDAGRIDSKKYEVPTESNVIKTNFEESENEKKFPAKVQAELIDDEEEEEEEEHVEETNDEGAEDEEEVASEEKTEAPSLPDRVVEATTTTRKPFRIRVPTESELEDTKKNNRRIIKVHRGELRNQRLNQPKYKRIRKTSTQAPVTAPDDLTFNRENEIQSTYKPIVVLDGLTITKELSGNSSRNSFRFTVEEPKVEVTERSKFQPGLFAAGNATISVETLTLPVTRAYDKPKKPIFPSVEFKPIIVPNREPPSSEKPLFLITTKPQTNRTVTVQENRASTTKPYVRGKFKPSENSKIRFRPTTASPDSETTLGPHLSTRQPSYTIGNTGNEVNVNRGTPPSINRGTRPTLKPSTAIVSKASDFIDIYRYPPSRPANLYATPTPDKSAAKCRKDVCLLPDCSCGGKDIPGGYAAEEIPQLVLLTFDDSVNDLNKGLYSELFERGRVNPNGCPISATFYVSHEWTDYSQVQNLYANGHEIASHSISHSFGEQFSQKKWTKEIAGQREILAAYGGVRLEDIRGMRAPFLAVGGNKMFKMLYDSNFTYDSSMPIYENRPPSWPYTLDYKLFHDCMIPPCPTKSYPGVWEVPMVMWQDLNGGRCSMGDACSNPPTADGVYKMLIKNFERHFTTNRAPFGLYYHAAWFTHEHHKEGFIAFLDTIVNMPEVWLVTTWQAIEWVRDPQPLSTVENFPPFQCNIEKAKKCNNPKVCNLWHKSGVRYMRTCQPCPDVYPWTGKTGVKNSRVDNEIIEE